MNAVPLGVIEWVILSWPFVTGEKRVYMVTDWCGRFVNPTTLQSEKPMIFIVLTISMTNFNNIHCPPIPVWEVPIV